MAFPLIPLAIGGGLALKSFAGKETVPQLPPEVIAQIMAAVRRDRSTMYFPDESTFLQKADADVADILSQLPVAQEAFNAQAASRGVFRSGEALTNLFSTVYAPIARAASQAKISNRLAYQDLRFRAQSTAENQALQALQLLVGAIRPQGGDTTALQDAAYDIGDLAQYFGLAKAFGLT